MEDKFIQKHLDAIKVMKGLNNQETFYVSCDINEPGAMRLGGTEIYVRRISVHNLQFAFQTKELHDKNKLD